MEKRSIRGRGFASDADTAVMTNSIRTKNAAVVLLTPSTFMMNTSMIFSQERGFKNRRKW